MSDICVSHPWTVERAYSRSKAHGTFPSHMCTSHVDTGPTAPTPDVRSTGSKSKYRA